MDQLSSSQVLLGGLSRTSLPAVATFGARAWPAPSPYPEVGRVAVGSPDRAHAGHAPGPRTDGDVRCSSGTRSTRPRPGWHQEYLASGRKVKTNRHLADGAARGS